MYGSSGAGSSMHLSMELLKSLTATDMAHVPYKGSAIFLTDLLSGQITAICCNIPSLLPHIRSGKVRPLAVTSPRPSPRLPGVPTFAEAGVPLEVVVWYAIFAPAAVPKPILAKLNAGTVKVLNMPATRRYLDEQGVDTRPSTPEELAEFVRVETKRWQQAVKVSGAKVN